MKIELRPVWSWTLPVLCAITALYALTFPLQDPDTFWHLAYGRAMVSEGRFINHEIFSYTAAGRYLGSHSQLAQVLLYLLWSVGKANTLLGFKLLIGLTTFLLVARTAKVFAVGRMTASVLALLVILAGMSRFVERPELFSILLQAFMILLLFGYRQGVYGVRALWILPGLLVVWDYLHGALFGLVILLSFVFAETLKIYLVSRVKWLAGWCTQILAPNLLKQLWLWSGISLLVMCLHPNGLLNYSHFWRVSSKTAEYAMYGEFMPTSLIPQFFWFWVIFSVTVSLAVLCFRRLDLSEVSIVIPFLYLGLKYNRAALAFALASVPLMAHCLSMVNERFVAVRWWRGASLALTIVLLLTVPYYKEVFAPSIFRFGTGLNELAFPVGSTRFIADVGLNGNMFNTNGAGGYLAFSLSPERKIFNYNQPGVFTALTEYVHKPESRSRWDIRYALIADAKEYAMFQRDGFVPVYHEANGMILLKPTPENMALIEKYRIRYFDPLKSTAELEALSKNSLVVFRLCEEISIYLTYRRDARIATVLAKLLLPANPNLEVDLESRRVWLEAALRQNADDLSLLKTLGEITFRQGDFVRAAAAFDAILVDAPKHIEVLLHRGYVDYGRKAYREAAVFFRQAVNAAPKEAEPHYALGLAAFRMGDKELMQIEFQKFLKLAPDSPFAEKARQFMADVGR